MCTALQKLCTMENAPGTRRKMSTQCQVEKGDGDAGRIRSLGGNRTHAIIFRLCRDNISGCASLIVTYYYTA